MIVPEIAFAAVVVEQPVIAQPPVVVERQQVLRVQPQAQAMYWCDNPRGYSPSVSKCPSGWRTIPAQMVPAQPPPPPPAE
ncbi:MAG: hypothetical protein HQK96_08555 [Nitrospirae bacterium]|nr:hypothetical protein [Nitrospirota bacterium]